MTPTNHNTYVFMYLSTYHLHLHSNSNWTTSWTKQACGSPHIAVGPMSQWHLRGICVVWSFHTTTCELRNPWKISDIITFQSKSHVLKLLNHKILFRTVTILETKCYLEKVQEPLPHYHRETRLSLGILFVIKSFIKLLSNAIQHERNN